MIIKKAKDKILNEMLGRLPEDYDKSEGGLFYDNLAPISIEMETLFEKLKYIFDNSFAKTAEGIYLDYMAEEVGVFRKAATKSVGKVTIKGNTGIKVELGTQVASDSYIYTTTEEGVIGETGEITLSIESQEGGAIYNVPAQAINLFPVTIKGLQEVTNKEATKDGYDEETDEELKDRYYLKVRNPITSGNVYHYKKWCKEVEGVGGVKVYPLWKGAGTVKCVIANKDIEIAPQELLERVRVHIEEVRPIGADVTIESATSKDIRVSATIDLAKNTELEEVKTMFMKSVSDYLRAIAFEATEVSYAKIGSLLLATPGVLDYKLYFLNNGVINVQLTNEDIPKLTTVNLTKARL